MTTIADILATMQEAEQTLKVALANPHLGPQAFQELKNIQRTLANIETVLRSQQQPMPSDTLLSIMCAGIKDFEGWAAPGESLNGTKYPQGTTAWQCKNPGNLRCGPNKAYWNHLAIGSRGGFCVFRDEPTGLQAQKDVIISVASGKAPANSPYQIYAKEHGLASSSELTLLQYMIVRDPPADANDPDAYAKFLGARMGVDYSAWQLKALVG